MAFQLSPGVNVSEVDLTTVVPSVGTTAGGLAGNFAWGPVNEIITLDNEIQLVDTFGKPDANTYQYFFTASNFLSYGGTLRAVRSANNTARNATTSGTGVLVENRDDYEQNHSSGSGSDTFIAKYPGALGNSLKVSLVDANTYVGWTYSSSFSDSPDTSDWATAKGGTNDELHIVVVDTTGAFSGTANTVLEKFGFVSKASDAKNSDGSTNYYKDVVNNRSKYVWWASHPAAGTNWGTAAAGVTFTNTTSVGNYTLSGGVVGNPTTGDLTSSYDKFENPESVDVSFLLAGPTSGSTIPNYLVSIAETRKDCLVFISPSSSDVIDNAGSEATDIATTRAGHTSSSYAVMDSAWKYQYDKYNDTYRWIPLNGDIAGLCVRTDNQRDQIGRAHV